MQGQPWHAMMFAEIQKLAFDLVVRYLAAGRLQFGNRLGTFATNVHDRGMRIEHHLPAGFFHAFTVVHLLVIKEVARVEQANLIEHFPTHQIEAAWQPVALPDRVMIPAHFVDHFQPREKTPEPGAGNKYIQRRWKVAAAGLQITLAPYQANAQDTAIRVGVHVFDGFAQAVGGHKGVGVEQQRVLALQVFKQLIVGTTKADVFLIAQQLRLRAYLGQALQRIVDRGVVHHQIAGKLFAIGLAQRVKHRLQQGCGIEVDHQHVDGLASHCFLPRKSTAALPPQGLAPAPGRKPHCAA
ncbi:hypothetical protein D3C76_1076310 [compost metagenome]